MALVEYTLEDHVAIVTMKNGDNRFNPDFLEDFLSVLDQVENETKASALVVRSAHEKIWSNGLDLDWLMPMVQEQNTEATKAFFYRLNDLFKRVLMFPCITVASINGHAFAGGAILSCAFDYRIMRSDRGFFCFPEVDINIPFLPGMAALLAKAMPQHVHQDMTLTGKRLTADQCVEKNIMIKAFANDVLFEETIAFVKDLKKGRPVVKAIKDELYADALFAIEKKDPPIIESGRLQV